MSTTPRDVAIVATSQTPSYRLFNDSEPKLIMRCVNDILERTGLDRSELQFTIAGSCDYLSGMPSDLLSKVLAAVLGLMAVYSVCTLLAEALRKSK